MTQGRSDIERQEENPAFVCAECGAPVALLGEHYFRECDHAGAAILANMKAVVYGMARVE